MTRWKTSISIDSEKIQENEFDELLKKSCSNFNIDFKYRSQAITDLILKTANPKPKSDLPETKRNLLDPSLPQETLKARKELIEKVNSPPSYPIPPCHYASKDKFIDPKTHLEYIYCDNPKRTKGKPLQIPLIVCVKCWERRSWFNKQRKNTPKEIKEIYCKQSGLWVKPTACINCKTPCEKAPPTNPYLSDIQRYHNSQNQKER